MLKINISGEELLNSSCQSQSVNINIPQIQLHLLTCCHHTSQLHSRYEAQLVLWEIQSKYKIQSAQLEMVQTQGLHCYICPISNCTNCSTQIKILCKKLIKGHFDKEIFNCYLVLILPSQISHQQLNWMHLEWVWVVPALGFNVVLSFTDRIAKTPLDLITEKLIHVRFKWYLFRNNTKNMS